MKNYEQIQKSALISMKTDGNQWINPLGKLGKLGIEAFRCQVSAVGVWSANPYFQVRVDRDRLIEVKGTLTGVFCDILNYRTYARY